MKRMIVILLAGHLWFGSSGQSDANPSLTGRAALDRTPTIAEIIRNWTPKDCAYLAELLSQYGLLLLERETIELVRDNWSVLEPCFIASQVDTSRLEWGLHQELSALGSDSAKASVCAVLRKRLALPEQGPELPISTDPETYAREHWSRKTATRLAAYDLLEVADILAEYRDPLATSHLNRIIDELESSPIDTEFAREGDPLSWFIKSALRRIDDPDYGAIVIRDSAGNLKVVRSPDEVRDISCSRAKEMHLGWQSIDIPPARILEFIGRLHSVPRLEPKLDVENTVRVRVLLDDGFQARLFASLAGDITYGDNTRCTASNCSFWNPHLAEEFLALVRNARTIDNGHDSH